MSPQRAHWRDRRGGEGEADGDRLADKNPETTSWCWAEETEIGKEEKDIQHYLKIHNICKESNQSMMTIKDIINTVINRLHICIGSKVHQVLQPVQILPSRRQTNGFSCCPCHLGSWLSHIDSTSVFSSIEWEWSHAPGYLPWRGGRCDTPFCLYTSTLVL